MGYHNPTRKWNTTKNAIVRLKPFDVKVKVPPIRHIPSRVCAKTIISPLNGERNGVFFLSVSFILHYCVGRRAPPPLTVGTGYRSTIVRWLTNCSRKVTPKDFAAAPISVIAIFKAVIITPIVRWRRCCNNHHFSSPVPSPLGCRCFHFFCGSCCCCRHRRHHSCVHEGFPLWTVIV